MVRLTHLLVCVCISLQVYLLSVIVGQGARTAIVFPRHVPLMYASLIIHRAASCVQVCRWERNTVVVFEVLLCMTWALMLQHACMSLCICFPCTSGVLLPPANGGRVGAGSLRLPLGLSLFDTSHILLL